MVVSFGFCYASFIKQLLYKGMILCNLGYLIIFYYVAPAVSNMGYNHLITHDQAGCYCCAHTFELFCFWKVHIS